MIRPYSRNPLRSDKGLGSPHIRWCPPDRWRLCNQGDSCIGNRRQGRDMFLGYDRVEKHRSQSVHNLILELDHHVSVM